MIYAVDEINRNSSILPNVSLGYMIYDSCFNMHKTLTAALSFLGQKFSNILQEVCPIHAVVGESGSQHSSTIARFFALFLIPQVRLFIERNYFILHELWFLLYLKVLSSFRNLNHLTMHCFDSDKLLCLMSVLEWQTSISFIFANNAKRCIPVNRHSEDGSTLWLGLHRYDSQ